MQGISFMQMLQSQPASQGGISEASGSANTKGSFFQLLNDSLTKNDLEGSLLKESISKEQFEELFAGNKLELLTLLQEGGNKKLLTDLFSGRTEDITGLLNESELNELTEIQNLISQLIDELSGSDALIAEDVLANPMVEELLGQFSNQLQQQLQTVFEEHDSLKSLLEQDEGNLDNPVQLLAVVIGIAHIQSQFNSEIQFEQQAQAHSGSELAGRAPEQAIEKIQIQLEKLLAMLTQNEQAQVSSGKTEQRGFQEIIKQLTSSLQAMSTKQRDQLTQNSQAQNQSSKEAQFVLAAFSRISAEQTAKVNQGIVLPPTSQGQLNSVQQFVIHVGDNQGNQPNNEQILRQFQNILGRSSLAQFPNGTNQLSIKLYPEHLGRLDVKLTQQNGVIVAELMTTTKAAKNAIESQLHQLKQAFVAQNIQVDKIEINTQQQQQSLGQQPDKENQEEKNDNQANQEQKQNHDDVNETVTFEDFLEESFNAKV